MSFHTDLTHLPETDLDAKATDILTLSRAARQRPRAPAVRHGVKRRGARHPGNADRDLQPAHRHARAARGEVSSAVQNVGGAFTAIDELLEDGLDRLMLPFQPGDFYKEYESARVIVDPAGSETKKAAILDGNTSSS